MFTAFGNAVARSLINAQTMTANTSGTGQDTNGYDGVGRVTVNVGAMTGTAPTVQVELWSSPDNATWTDTGVGSAVISATGAYVFDVDLGQFGRYLQARTTVGGTTPSFPMSATLAMVKKQ